jgi:hypothetical protein
MLQQILQNDIYKTLRISYDGLRDMEKAIFLDRVMIFGHTFCDNFSGQLVGRGIFVIKKLQTLLFVTLFLFFYFF